MHGGFYMKKSTSKFIADIMYFILGTFIYSVAVNVFLLPNGISAGGFTGIATVINYITSIPTGITLFALNSPVLILGYIKIGSIFILKTSFVTAILSLILDITARILPPFKSDGILVSVFGGILMGLGLSIVLLRGATTGGIDIIAKMLNSKYRHISVGKIILAADGLVVMLNAAVYKNVESALYSVVAIYVSTRIMDLLLYGADKGKIIYIVTNNADLICKVINTEMHRGVTRISTTGGYTGEEHIMLMCTVRNHEAAAVHNIVREYDSGAFIVVCDAGEIIGTGFKPQT